MRAFLLITTLALALAGARTAHAEDKPPEPLAAAKVEKLLTFYDALVDGVVKNASDCAALAAAVDGVVTQYTNTIEMMWAAKKAKKVLPKDAQDQMDKRAQEMVGALRKCLEDKGVKAAFKRLKPPKDKP